MCGDNSGPVVVEWDSRHGLWSGKSPGVPGLACLHSRPSQALVGAKHVAWMYKKYRRVYD